MFNKLRKITKIPVVDRNGKTKLIKIKYLAIALMTVGAMTPIQSDIVAEAAGCPSLRAVFARGSGGERWTTDDYLEFKDTLESKLATTNLNYEFIDLDYTAVGIGYGHLHTAIGAYVSGAESYEFGDSVKSGVKNLDKLINDSCPNTKYVIGGYSQGAIVVSKALPLLNPDKLIYAATFGDPKLYLPEGEGLIPSACRGENLSDYRAYVPDCKAYKGLLGAYVPYEPAELAGKVGAWCNRRDIFCSSRFGIADHLNYISDGLYEDASKVMFDKIAEAFDFENTVTSPHDTVILIDSSNSMDDMIHAYKEEALRLAEESINAGGRVALYDYRDLNDPYQPVEHCNFDTCNLETFQRELESIETDGGGDEFESMLSTAFTAMKTLEWKKGAVKSLIVLTDTDFLAPDRNGITYNDVIELSREIDPVNFYVITKAKYAEAYADLAEKTDGKVVTNMNELNLLTDYILARNDTLPPVEKNTEHQEYPIEITDVEKQNDGTYKINFENSGAQAIVILNDTILGITNQKELIIGELNQKATNTLILAPLVKGGRGEAVEVVLTTANENENVSKNVIYDNHQDAIVPKTPNTGGR